MIATPEVIAAGILGGGGVMTAASLALFYQGLLHNPENSGVPTCSPTPRATSVARCPEPLFGIAANRSTAFDRPATTAITSWRLRQVQSIMLPSTSFGHAGMHMQVGWPTRRRRPVRAPHQRRGQRRDEGGYRQVSCPTSPPGSDGSPGSGPQHPSRGCSGSPRPELHVRPVGSEVVLLDGHAAVGVHGLDPGHVADRSRRGRRTTRSRSTARWPRRPDVRRRRRGTAACRPTAPPPGRTGSVARLVFASRRRSWCTDVVGTPQLSNTESWATLRHWAG